MCAVIEGWWCPFLCKSWQRYGKRISNPAYKGIWEAKKIANPEYEDDESVYKFADFGFLGFDLWQVKGGTIFDNVIVTDDSAEAERVHTYLYIYIYTGCCTNQDV